jgi:hypothetical protein
MILQQLISALAPWQSAYSDSKVIPAVVTTVHLVALFWVKLGLVALLLINGIVLERTESTLRALSSRQVVPTVRVAQLWRRLRASAVCSLGLWTATLIAGALLVNVA